jgi:2'-5' RNA ligase
MPYAVTLGLDPVAAAAVSGLLVRLADAGVADDILRLGYAPHVTLAVYPEAVGAAALRAAIDGLSWAAVPVSFPALGVFPGPPWVLWLAPVVTARLLQMQAELLATAPAVEPHYRPGAWMPHLTLTEELADGAAAGRALAVLAEEWQPVAGVLERVELVHFRPVEVLASRRLPGQASARAI